MRALSVSASSLAASRVGMRSNSFSMAWILSRTDFSRNAAGGSVRPRSGLIEIAAPRRKRSKRRLILQNPRRRERKPLMLFNVGLYLARFVAPTWKGTQPRRDRCGRPNSPASVAADRVTQRLAHAHLAALDSLQCAPQCEHLAATDRRAELRAPLLSASGWQIPRSGTPRRRRCRDSRSRAPANPDSPRPDVDRHACVSCRHDGARWGPGASRS